MVFCPHHVHNIRNLPRKHKPAQESFIVYFYVWQRRPQSDIAGYESRSQNLSLKTQTSNPLSHILHLAAPPLPLCLRFLFFALFSSLYVLFRHRFVFSDCCFCLPPRFVLPPLFVTANPPVTKQQKKKQNLQ